MKWHERLLKRLGFHVHERKLFLIGEIAFVKCVTCGAESIPWRPPLIASSAAMEFHTDDLSELIAINTRIKENQCERR